VAVQATIWAVVLAEPQIPVAAAAAMAMAIVIVGLVVPAVLV
jgi:hypothetical protein